MRNKVIFIIVLFVVCVAFYGIFNLVFPEPSALMACCIASGIVLAGVVGSNILVVSSHSSLTVKNAATTGVLYLFASFLFFWTMLFAFVLGPYEDGQRSLSGLYVGYLIILVLGLCCWLMADRGGSLAQKHSEAVDAHIDRRNLLFSEMNRLGLLLEGVETDSRSDIRRAFSQNVDLLRGIPSSVFASQGQAAELSEGITALKEAIAGKELAAISKANDQLALTLKSLRAL